MTGEISFACVDLIIFDFDGVFTDNTVLVSHDGVELVRCWLSDGLGLSLLKRAGVKINIISTETNHVVSVRARKLDLPCLQAIEDKADAVSRLCAELSVPLANTMLVGNYINICPSSNVLGQFCI